MATIKKVIKAQPGRKVKYSTAPGMSGLSFSEKTLRKKIGNAKSSYESSTNPKVEYTTPLNQTVSADTSGMAAGKKSFPVKVTSKGKDNYYPISRAAAKRAVKYSQKDGGKTVKKTMKTGGKMIMKRAQTGETLPSVTVNASTEKKRSLKDKIFGTKEERIDRRETRQSNRAVRRSERASMPRCNSRGCGGRAMGFTGYKNGGTKKAKTGTKISKSTKKK